MAPIREISLKIEKNHETPSRRKVNMDWGQNWIFSNQQYEKFYTSLKKW